MDHTYCACEIRNAEDETSSAPNTLSAQWKCTFFVSIQFLLHPHYYRIIILQCSTCHDFYCCSRPSVSFSLWDLWDKVFHHCWVPLLYLVHSFKCPIFNLGRIAGFPFFTRCTTFRLLSEKMQVSCECETVPLWISPLFRSRNNAIALQDLWLRPL